MILFQFRTLCLLITICYKVLITLWYHFYWFSKYYKMWKKTVPETHTFLLPQLAMTPSTFCFFSPNRSKLVTSILIKFLAWFHFLVIHGFGSFWIRSLHRSMLTMLVFFKASFLVLCSSYYILVIFLMMLYVILLALLMILIPALKMIGLLICGRMISSLDATVTSCKKPALIHHKI